MHTRKVPKITFLCILIVLFLTVHSHAKISGQPCSNCHTMHNSQNAADMRLGEASIRPGPSPECYDCHGDVRTVLLQLDCLGCHAQNPGGGSNIINNWPQVAHNAGNDLAGGNYSHIISNDDSYGHNVHGFGSNIPTGDLGNNPPGYNALYDPSTGKYQPSTVSGQIMCAGRDGCHGNREELSPYLAIKGTHHVDDFMLKFGSINEGQQGSTSGTSYRFLYKVLGGEDSDWEASVTATDHNEYKGEAFASRALASGQNWADINTISEFCAECHGVFHASDQITGQTPPSGSPWLRHPTDAVLPNSGEYSAYTVYSTEAPVARPVIPTDSAHSTVIPGDSVSEDGAIVMCLSCHRAHASEYPDILRWDYSTMNAGGGGSGGCFTCHTQKK